MTLSLARAWRAVTLIEVLIGVCIGAVCVLFAVVMKLMGCVEMNTTHVKVVEHGTEEEKPQDEEKNSIHEGFENLMTYDAPTGLFGGE